MDDVHFISAGDDDKGPHGVSPYQLGSFTNRFSSVGSVRDYVEILRQL